MTTGKANSTDAPADREIVITRDFDAPCELVWQAMTDPLHVVLTTTDSNTWGGASGHTYNFTRRPDGLTDIEYVVVREGKTLKGRVLSAVFGTIGKGVLKKAFVHSVKAIEARDGVTTGISAHDRARTIAVAINPECGRDDIVTPGHVFPLMAREGGTLVRAGHTEASVDIARKAGLYPAAVICEIMNDDGTMARLPDLIAFAQRHNLKLGTIADLIAHRRVTERLVKRVAEGDFDHVAGGDWRVVVNANTVEYQEHLALVKGDVADGKPVLVRVHSECLTGDVFGSRRCDCVSLPSRSRSGLLWSAAT